MAVLVKFCEQIGWASDLKKPSSELIARTIKVRGDGKYEQHKPNSPLYDWIAGWAVSFGPLLIARFILAAVY